MGDLARVRRRLGDEDGSLILEFVISLAFLTIAVGALMTVFASSIISLSTAGISGTAQSLVERQMEAYKRLPYASLVLSSSTLPASTSTYYTAPPTAVGTSFTNVTGGTAASSACTNPTNVNSQCAVQTLTGPEGRTYRIDSYIVSHTPSGGRAGVRITVVVRLNSSPAKILAQTSSAYDPASPPS